MRAVRFRVSEGQSYVRVWPPATRPRLLTTRRHRCRRTGSPPAAQGRARRR